GPKGRQGIRIASACAEACAAMPSALPGVSIITRSASFARACSSSLGKRGACAGTTAGIVVSRRSPHTVEFARGSRSKIAVASPCASAATAKFTAKVVFPAPPFSLTMASIFIAFSLVSLVTNNLYNKDTYQNVKEITCYQISKLASSFRLRATLIRRNLLKRHDSSVRVVGQPARKGLISGKANPLPKR